MLGRKVIEQITNEELVRCVSNAVEDILSRYPQILAVPKSDVVAADMKISYDEFKTTFSHWIAQFPPP